MKTSDIRIFHSCIYFFRPLLYDAIDLERMIVVFHRPPDAAVSGNVQMSVGFPCWFQSLRFYSHIINDRLHFVTTNGCSCDMFSETDTSQRYIYKENSRGRKKRGRAPFSYIIFLCRLIKHVTVSWSWLPGDPRITKSRVKSTRVVVCSRYGEGGIRHDRKTA